MAVKAFASRNFKVSVTTETGNGYTKKWLKDIDMSTGEFEQCENEKDAHEFTNYGAAQVTVINIYRHLTHTDPNYMFGIESAGGV